jgi:hypothetical protein
MCDNRSKTDPIESRVRNGQRRTESTISIACTVWRIARLTSNREFQKIRKFAIFGNLLKLLWEFVPTDCAISHKTGRGKKKLGVQRHAQVPAGLDSSCSRPGRDVAGSFLSNEGWSREKHPGLAHRSSATGAVERVCADCPMTRQAERGSRSPRFLLMDCRERVWSGSRDRLLP